MTALFPFQCRTRVLAAAALALWIATAQEPAGSSIQSNTRGVLTAGKPVKREIAGSEVHSYGIDLEKGEYLTLSIRPHGIELISELLAPDDTLAATTSLLHAANDPMSVAYVAEVSGSHTLRVHPTRGDAPPGRYEVEMSAPRAASAEEAGRSKAMREFAQGQKLTLTGNAEENKTAITHYGNALDLFREMRDQKGELMAMTALAETHVWFGDPQEALSCYTRAIQLSHDLGDRYREANIYVGVGRIQATFGSYQDALTSYERALEIYRGMSARYGEALALALTGATYHFLGDYRRALEIYEKALPTFHSVGDAQNEGTLLNYIGRAYEISQRQSSFTPVP